MAVSVPTHKIWSAFKKTHGVGANAVGSVNVGKALDTYHKKFCRDFKVNIQAADALAKELVTYKSKFPEKKAKNGKKFLSEFDKEYVKMAIGAKEEFSTMAGEMKAFGGRVQTLLAVSAKLKAGMPIDTLQKFRQGPVRGTLAAATQVKKYDPAHIHKLWKPIDDMINSMPNDAEQAKLDRLINLIHNSAQNTLKICKKDGLF